MAAAGDTVGCTRQTHVRRQRSRGAGHGHVLSLHGAFASAFFGCIFASCLMMSKRSLNNVADAERRARFHRAYRLIHAIMIGSVAMVVLSRLLPAALQHSLCDARALFWFEAVGVWCFGAYWYIKTRELDPAASWAPFMARKAVAAEPPSQRHSAP